MTAQMSVAACCAAIYGSPAVELLVGDSLHPGGLGSTRALLRATGLPPGSRLLDVGCGLGSSSRLAASEVGLAVEAIDPSSTAIERARERTPDDRAVRYRVGSVLALPYPDASFDAVLAECVLSTVPKDEALAEIRRVLRAGGWLLLSDVTRAVDWTPDLTIAPPLSAALCLEGAWLPGEIDRRLANAGFVNERTTDQRSSLLDMLNRVHARIELLAAVGRDLGSMTSIAPLMDGLTLASGLTALGAVRVAVEERRLGYMAVAATVDLARDAVVDDRIGSVRGVRAGVVIRP